MLLDTLARHKETLLREHREQEESRRLAVDYAVKVGWMEDRLAVEDDNMSCAGPAGSRHPVQERAQDPAGGKDEEGGEEEETK